MQLCGEGSTRRGHNRIAMVQMSWTNQKSVDQSEPGVEPGQHRQFYVIDERPQEGRDQLEKSAVWSYISQYQVQGHREVAPDRRTFHE